VNFIKKGLGLALLTGIILLAVTGLTKTTVYAHSHGGGGNHHHDEHPHVHHPAGEHQHIVGTSCYHHSHDDQGDHHHPCRPVSATVAPSQQVNSSSEECQNHDGQWEPSQGN